jgi:hypothetical protein
MVLNSPVERHRVAQWIFYFILFLNLLFIYSHVHTLFGSFLPPAPLSTPSLPGGTCSALISNFVEEKT